MDTTTIIILSIFGCVILGILMYTLLVFLKGKVKLVLDTTSFNSGDVISGKILKKKKKQIESNRLTVKLIGKEGRRERSSNGKSTMKWITIYEDEIQVDGENSYAAGLKEELPFQIKTPSSELVKKPEIKNEVLNTIVSVAERFSTKKLKWKIEVVLDAKGVDLRNSKKLYITFTEQNNNSISN